MKIQLIMMFMALGISGCITQKNHENLAPLAVPSSPTKLKQIQLSVSGNPFEAFPGLENTLNGPKLRKRDTVVVVVEALDTEVHPVNYSFYCPELDVRQESTNPQFEFAVTETLLKKGSVVVEVRVNSAPSSMSGRSPFILRFDIQKL